MTPANRQLYRIVYQPGTPQERTGFGRPWVQMLAQVRRHLSENRSPIRVEECASWDGPRV